MINPNEIKVIDPEFAFYGPIGFDIGAVLGNLVLNYASQEYHAKAQSQRAEYKKWLLETIKNVWIEFEKEFRILWIKERIPGEWESDEFLDLFLTHVLQDSVGFGACKITRRLFGLAHVPDMWEIPDDYERAKCESIAFNVGRQWLLKRKQVNNPDDMLHLIKEYAFPDKSIQ
jgi:5-methylthioribose kinase